MAKEKTESKSEEKPEAKLPNNEELADLMKKGKNVICGEVVSVEAAPEGRGKSSVQYDAKAEGEENPEQAEMFDADWAKKKQSAVKKKR